MNVNRMLKRVSRLVVLILVRLELYGSQIHFFGPELRYKCPIPVELLNDDIEYALAPALLTPTCACPVSHSCPRGASQSEA